MDYIFTAHDYFHHELLLVSLLQKPGDLLRNPERIDSVFAIVGLYNNLITLKELLVFDWIPHDLFSHNLYTILWCIKHSVC